MTTLEAKEELIQKLSPYITKRCAYVTQATNTSLPVEKYEIVVLGNFSGNLAGLLQGYHVSAEEIGSSILIKFDNTFRKL